MLAGITLKFGSSRRSTPLSFQPGPVTVFVGPNNSGKTLILREIRDHILADQPEQQASARRIVGQLAVRWPSWDEIRPWFVQWPPGSGQTPLNPSTGWTYHSDLNALYRVIEEQHNPQSVQHAARIFVRASTLLLDGERRLTLLNPAAGSDLRSRPGTILQALLQDDARRHRLADLSRDAFDLHFIVDTTALQHLRARFSSTPPSDPALEKSLGQDAISFFGQALPIENVGDGIKAFTGVMAAALASDVKIILIDEPEAFLHPPTANKLGANLVALGSEREGNLVVSTHSADVLMGCVHAGKPLNIVRLTYDGALATARLLSPTEIKALMLDPLLRSTAVLSALFYRGAVVCEADSDRAFYQEVNERLLASNRAGCPDCVFLNAQNKNTVRKIIEPLRKMGVPAAAVVDLDILKRDDLRNLMRAASVPDGVVKSLGQLRGEVLAAFRRCGLEPGEAGIDALDGDDRQSALKLLSDLRDYGIFVVPVGKLERWLADLHVTGEKVQWLTNVFTTLGSDPASPGYIRPSPGDVWAFIDEVGRWIANPDRKGIPE